MSKLIKERLNVPYAMIAVIADQLGAIEVYWRESDRSYTGYVAEVWFDKLPSEFSYLWSQTVNTSILVRKIEELGFSISIPCTVPEGEIKLFQGQRNNKRSKLKLTGDSELIKSYYPKLNQ
ncbi:hypothetical protein [Geminocystis sp. NIES-3709]|uniref:hypothetical protein n=1 Tax=Geminocystis sp. NIES-3709 TaxID=1617448 RepID=UPI0005FC8C96|nr:hypothetical protein [Geminocystis sp. NIES-3709]BAQ63954.1 hypothetical protein GM3709_719 [Geminocystis sp. NIES-3709]